MRPDSDVCQSLLKTCGATGQIDRAQWVLREASVEVRDPYSKYLDQNCITTLYTPWTPGENKILHIHLPFKVSTKAFPLNKLANVDEI